MPNSGINFDYLIYLVYDFFVTLYAMFFDESLRANIFSWLNLIWWIFFFVSILLLAGIIYFVVKVEKVWRGQHGSVYGKTGLIEEIKEELEVAKPEHNEIWEKIVKLIGSDNPNDWKAAILEADKVLEIVVNTFAVPGENMGDKMKNIEKSDWQTLDEAWQAHKVRNRIAHEQNFHIGQREARKTIDNYEKVFQEFDFI